MQAVNLELIPVAAGKAPITDCYVWMGCTPDPNFLAHLTRGFSVWNGGELQPYQVHRASVDFALQLNHLVIRLIRCPDATAGLKLAYTVTARGITFKCVPLISPIPAAFSFPCSHLFPNFYAFLDTLEVHVKPPAQGGLKSTKNTHNSFLARPLFRIAALLLSVPMLAIGVLALFTGTSTADTSRWKVGVSATFVGIGLIVVGVRGRFLK
jgi:hypothetical protein